VDSMLSPTNKHASQKLYLLIVSVITLLELYAQAALPDIILMLLQFASQSQFYLLIAKLSLEQLAQFAIKDI
jgi:hypothetical protein